MELGLLLGSGNPPLGEAIARRLGTAPAEVVLERFPDGESRVAIRSRIRGDDVYVIQSVGPPVDEHLVELLMLADAARRSGASRVTAVVPYLAYARQDRRVSAGEPVGMRVVADLLAAVHVDRVLVVDPHTAALEAMFGMPVERVSAGSVLADALRPLAPADAVVVAPDLGAVKLAERYAAVLDLPVAIVRKTRLSGTSVRAEEVVGDVAGRVPIVVDDMISTAGTISAAMQALLQRGCEPSLLVAATHGLLVGPAVERLSALPLRQLIVTDSVLPRGDVALPHQVVGMGGLLADTIRSLHHDEALDELVP